MLQYTLRVRDLVHGTILFTEQEERIINHPFFQRLRQIRQNDVAFSVYPSINTSRFEHVLGTCRVAGMMAENLTKSSRWKTYSKELKEQTGIASREQFVELSRLYALLHDVGHLPLSHLFEIAVREYAQSRTPRISKEELAQEWSGQSGFDKLHEAFGAVITQQILHNVALPEPIRRTLLKLMTEKTFPLSAPLSVVKSLIDSEIDADRADFVRRDGLLAGGEYGNYDVRRLCDSVFIERDEEGWLIAYSEKAITSIEALLFDRYRTHVWIHFHHRVVATKMLVRLLIVKALEQGLITKEHFNPAHPDEFALRDDVWLWNVLRGMETQDETTRMIQRAVFYREKKNVLTLWKNRPAYHELLKKVADKARVDVVSLGFPEFYKEYEKYLSDRLGIQALVFSVPFEAISEKAVPLYSEAEKKLTDRKLREVSRLVAELNTLWKAEPQFFVLLVDENATEKVGELRKKWIELTARWIQP